MKTIKIFLASSEELKNDRVSFGNFIRELDKRYQQRGIRIDLYTWEGADGAYNGRRKQDEYNDNVRDSDMLVALFYIKAGGFTQEEFHEAVKSFNDTGRPKVYVYFRQLEDESKVSEELKKFKEELEGQDARGHFAYRYNNDDSLHLDFVMQLLLQDKIQKDELNIEEGQVMLNGMVIAQMDNLQFATDNKGNQDLIKDLEKIEIELNEIRQALDQNPNIDFIKKQYELKKNEYNQKKEELEKHQKNLLNTAIRIANLQKDHITDETKRAIEAFNSGDAPRADFLLDEAEHNTKQIKEQLLAAKEVAYQKIEQLLLHASFKINNTTIHVDERIEQTQKKYEEAISLAQDSGYNDIKYSELIEKYGDFLQEYEKYEEALVCRKELVDINKKIYGEDDPHIAIACTKLGLTLDFNNIYDESLNMLQNALNILEKQQDDKYRLEVAEVYNNLGNVYLGKGNYEAALKWHQKALDIRLKIGENTYDTARSFHNLGNIMYEMDRTDESLHYYHKSIKIKEHINDNDKLLANSYYCVSFVYLDLKKYDEAFDFMKKAINIFEKVLGGRHRKTIHCYYQIGRFYFRMHDYEHSLKWESKAANQGHKLAQSDMTWFYMWGKGVKQDYYKACEWIKKEEGVDDLDAYHLLALLLAAGGNPREALQWAEKAAAGDPQNDSHTMLLALIYEDLECYNEALEQLELSLKIQLAEFGPCSFVERTEEKIAELKELMKNEGVSEQ